MSEDESSQVVLFELPDTELCQLLYHRLRDRWVAWLAARDELRFVAVSLDVDTATMERLLNDVAAWARDAGLRLVRVHLDGEMFVMIGKRADATDVPG